VVEPLEDRWLPSTFVVTSINDNGPGTLRDAIQAANAQPGLDQISFQIPGSGAHAIALASALPNISDSVVIDGTTQPGYAGTPIIELPGVLVGPNATGLTIQANGCTVKGLVIDRFSADGIDIFSDGNVLEGNWIGTNASGTGAAPNIRDGVFVRGANNRIGGTATGAGNVISGNGSNGVNFALGTGLVVLGNRIGTNASGTDELPNTFGILVASAANTTIGGTAPGAGNLISGNLSSGIAMADCMGTLVQGNLIGTNAAGTAALGNGDTGVLLFRGNNNTVGGAVAGAGNLVSGNVEGIVINEETGDVLQGNRIGIDAAGSHSLPNGDGVDILGGSNNTIGSVAPFGAGRNIISGNAGGGVVIRSFVDSAGTHIATANVVQSNVIGTDVTGELHLGNGGDGVLVDGTNNVIGGTASGTNNFITNNAGEGVLITSAVAISSGNQVEQNAITLNGKAGVSVDGTGNVIGAGNFISDNAGEGVLITSAVAISSGNQVEQNTITINGKAGVSVDGTGNVIGAGNFISDNAGEGVLITSGSSTGSGNRVQQNTITLNGKAGVAVIGSAVNNPIRGNSISANGGLGIDLGENGVTVNDPFDGDDGPNHLQNFPSLTAASSSATTTTVGGTLNSTPGRNFTIELFASAAADPSGFGEGQALIGSVLVSTDVFGIARFELAFPIPEPVGTFITATATDSAGNTSEFSAAKAIGPRLAAGADAGAPPQVNVYDAPTGTLQFSFLAYPASFRGGVRVAVGDVNGDGVPDIITAPGPGAALPIKVFDGDTGLQLPGPVGSFFPFGTTFDRGAFVAVGTFDGDHKDDLVVSADAGSLPRVQVVSGGSGAVLDDFLAFDRDFRGGVRVAVGDVNGDGYDDIVTAAGPGGLPLVNVFDGTNPAHVLRSFLAYPPGFDGGVYVAAGDLNGDGKADIVTGMGAGNRPLVEVFDGADGHLLARFEAYAADFRGGVRVGVIRDLNHDGRPEIVTGTGPGDDAEVKVFDGLTFAILDDFVARDSLHSGGVFVAGRR
jgi:hypothetical protein